MSLEINVAADHCVFVNHCRSRNEVIEQNASHHIQRDISLRTKYVTVNTDVGAEMNACSNKSFIKNLKQNFVFNVRHVPVSV